MARPRKLKIRYLDKAKGTIRPVAVVIDFVDPCTHDGWLRHVDATAPRACDIWGLLVQWHPTYVVVACGSDRAVMAKLKAGDHTDENDTIYCQSIDRRSIIQITPVLAPGRKVKP